VRVNDIAGNIYQALEGGNVSGGGFDIGLGISLEVELKAQLERRSARLVGRCRLNR
jgi:hypothetical protein